MNKVTQTNNGDAIKLGIYRHYKGNEYEVLGLALHSETEESMVVYKPLYGNQSLWVRPYDMFSESIELNGSIQPRFSWVRETE